MTAIPIRREARCMEAAMLSHQQAHEARELAWALCKLLAIPGHAEAAALHYQEALALIDAREMP